MKLAAAAFLFAVAKATAETAPAELSILETKVAQLLPGAAPASISVSPNGRHVAYFRKAPDGRHYSLVRDDEEGEEFDQVGNMRPLFSPNSERLAYVAERGEHTFVVLDGEIGEGYNAVGGVTFSPDSRHLAFMGSRAAERFIVLDRVEQSLRFDGLNADGPVFSSDSSRLGYVAKRGAKWVVVVDGRSGEEYDGAGAFVFGPDSKHWACFVQRADKSFILFDGIESAEYDGILRETTLRFTTPYTIEALAHRDFQIVHVALSKVSNRSTFNKPTTTNPRKHTR